MSKEQLRIQNYQTAFNTAFTGRRTQLARVMNLTSGTGQVFLHRFNPSLLAAPPDVDGLSIQPNIKTLTRRIDVRPYTLGTFISRDILDNIGPGIISAVQTKFFADMNLTIDRLAAVTALGLGDYMNRERARSNSEFTTQRLIQLENGQTRIPDYTAGRLSKPIDDNVLLSQFPGFTTVSAGTTGRLSLNDLIDTKVRLIQAVNSSSSFGMFLMINPTDLSALYKDSVLSSRIQLSADAASLTGYRETLLGFNIIPNEYVTAGKAACFTSDAFIMVLNEPQTATGEEVTKANGLSISVYVNMGIGVLREEELVIIDISGR